MRAEVEFNDSEVRCVAVGRSFAPNLRECFAVVGVEEQPNSFVWCGGDAYWVGDVASVGQFVAKRLNVAEESALCDCDDVVAPFSTVEEYIVSDKTRHKQKEGLFSILLVWDELLQVERRVLRRSAMCSQ